ncbi:efflux pump mlcE [Colletotrichum liriopes]|uniref:Efflux pump mlcE n=1 Tax=Colletotrichum liriopes TaxID=708192 RepID=A0AA37GEJ7_9PEZI|nr:efflux pump mlcE [Colletotrichum liriopes]
MNLERDSSCPMRPAAEYPSGPRLLAILTGVTLASFIMLLDMTIIVTAIPQITNQFNSLSDLGWYGSVYTFASASLQPMTGKLYSHLGTKACGIFEHCFHYADLMKWTFIGFIAVLEVGSLICGLAQSSNILIFGRAIAGLGTSGIMNGALTIIAASTPISRRPAVTGMVIGSIQKMSHSV